ncbi:MAG: imidazolonepropionase [Desulfobacterales bacterium]
MTEPAAHQPIDALWTDCHLATMAGPDPYGIVKNAALAVTNGRISWIGSGTDLPPDVVGRAGRVHRLGGAWVTPGLIDCHTHLVYAGSRAFEFEMRLNGATYEDIARAGGGILSTVKAVRDAGEDVLFDQSARRLSALQAEGVTTVEIKSGYGLDTASELKMLRVARELGRQLPVTVFPTFLGAHALPPEYIGRADTYIDLVVEEMLPAVAAEHPEAAVDAFCERIAFSVPQTKRVFSAAARLGLPVKLHAEQLSNQMGAALAAACGALSADHLEYIDADGIAAMAEHGTVGVILPGAFYYLKETRKPPVSALRGAGVPLAVSTDCNPGTSPCTSPLLMMNMACVFFAMTPAEALAGMTVNAARALGAADRLGSLEPGKKADFAVWDIAQPAELAYGIGGSPCRILVKNGEIVGGLP